MLNAFARPDARQNIGFLAGPLRRQQHQDRLAHSLGRRVTEHLLGAGVPCGDCAVERLGNDGVIGGIDDGRQALAFVSSSFALS